MLSKKGGKPFGGFLGRGLTCCGNFSNLHTYSVNLSIINYKRHSVKIFFPLLNLLCLLSQEMISYELCQSFFMHMQVYTKLYCYFCPSFLHKWTNGGVPHQDYSVPCLSLLKRIYLVIYKITWKSTYQQRIKGKFSRNGWISRT